jgi:hypothetical protein
LILLPPTLNAFDHLPDEEVFPVDLDARDCASMIAAEHDAVNRLAAWDAVDAGDDLQCVEFHLY